MTIIRPGRRVAFTLTELLVVVSILGILAALITAFMFGSADSRRRANTDLTIQAVNKILHQHWGQVIEDAKKEDITGPQFANLQKLSGMSAGVDPRGERARVIWIKLRLMEAFPQSYGEVNNPKHPVYQALNTYIPTVGQRTWRKYQIYQKLLNGKAAANDPNTESSACLLMALSQVSRAGVTTFAADTMPHAIADTDNDGIEEFIDAWTQPGGPVPRGASGAPDPFPPKNPGKPHALRFFRFAWSADIQQSMASAGGGTSAASNPAVDPIDNKGLLLNPSWYKLAGPAFVQATRCAITATPASPKNSPHYIIPVIVSAGSDGFFGLQQDVTNAATLGRINKIMPDPNKDDNIYNYNLRMP